MTYHDLNKAKGLQALLNAKGKRFKDVSLSYQVSSGVYRLESTHAKVHRLALEFGVSQETVRACHGISCGIPRLA